ncbi:MAG: transposase [Peptococcaceae bacterium]|nr:transposase [Peptococcaceae bacterium]
MGNRSSNYGVRIRIGVGWRIVKVPPGGTSQTCVCGAHVPKDLSVRLHKCPECGLVADRDVVSAMVILQRAS